jgi:hypothetical protein
MSVPLTDSFSDLQWGIDNIVATDRPFLIRSRASRHCNQALVTIRSIDDSLQRLGVDALDIVFVHDLSRQIIRGCPGRVVPSLPNAQYVACGDSSMLKTFLRTTDFIFVDNRGMGVSNPTKCNVAPSTDMPAYFAQIWPSKIISKCYADYSKATTSAPTTATTRSSQPAARRVTSPLQRPIRCQCKRRKSDRVSTQRDVPVVHV